MYIISYGVAYVSRIDEIIGLFGRRYSAKETLEECVMVCVNTENLFAGSRLRSVY